MRCSVQWWNWKAQISQIQLANDAKRICLVCREGEFADAKGYALKIKITFKSPDAVDLAMLDYNLTEDEKDKAKKLFKKFFKWDEYVDIEIDIEAGTASVLPA